MEFIDVLNAVIGPNEQGKYKTTIGFFVEEVTADGTHKTIDEFYIQKPLVQMSQFSDGEGKEYCCIEFVYKSKRDADLKQQWQFLERFVSLCLKLAQEGKELPALSISFIPISLEGKYSVLAQAAFPDSISCTEYATNHSCSIKTLFLKENIIALEHDDELVDYRKLEAEVSRDIDAELSSASGK